MKLRMLLLASAIGACFAAPALGADLASDAKTFGARDSVLAPDLSADGSHVIYITPGPGRKSIAVIGDLDLGKFTTATSSDGVPEVLRRCHFVSSTRSICGVTGTAKNSVLDLLGFSRLISLNNDGTDAKLLGQTDSVYDAGLHKAVIAIAPVTDLEMLKADFRDFTVSTLIDKEVGTGPQIGEGSPLRHAAASRAPVLLVHGDLDTNVKIAHSEKMDAALKSLGKQSELVTFRGLITNSTIRMRVLRC